jgi:hypothetical protein
MRSCARRRNGCIARSWLIVCAIHIEIARATKHASVSLMSINNTCPFTHLIVIRLLLLMSRVKLRMSFRSARRDRASLNRAWETRLKEVWFDDDRNNRELISKRRKRFPFVGGSRNFWSASIILNVSQHCGILADAISRVASIFLSFYIDYLSDSIPYQWRSAICIFRFLRHASFRHRMRTLPFTIARPARRQRGKIE